MRAFIAAVAAIATVALSLFAALPASAAGPGGGPNPDVATQKAAMSRLGWLAGAWEGTGWTLGPSGERWTFRQTEAVEQRLGGSILVIEGRGYAPDGAPNGGAMMFNAFAVVSFDDAKGKYAFRSYAMGRANTFEAELRADGAFVWSITPPSGPAMRYTITNPTPDAWVEIGERSSDGGQTWSQFFEMRLTRKTG